MTDFTERDTTHLGVDKFATSTTAFALYENLLAAFEGAVGAPRLQAAALHDSIVSQLTAVTPAIDDYFWIGDTSDSTKPKRALLTGLKGAKLMASGSCSGASVLASVTSGHVYSALLLKLVGASHNNAAAQILLSPNISGIGADTTASNYHSLVSRAAGVADGTLASMVESLNGGVAATFTGHLLITGYQQGPYAHYSGVIETGSLRYHTTGYYVSTATAGIDGIHIRPSAGSLDAGTYELYGIF
jgi:hypothetical protein